MMKFNCKLFLFRNLCVFLIMGFYIPVFAQFQTPIAVIEPAELIINYSLEFQEDSTNSQFIRQADMVLFIGSNTSKFLSYNYYIGDSILRGIHSPEEFQRLVLNHDRPMPLVRFQYEIFKNYPEGYLTCIDNVLGSGVFKYQEKLSLFSWQITGDTATIGGYKVQKATTKFGGRSWVAWFSPEIPYDDGPYKFSGLPGLIIKIHDTRNHYLFELVSIIKPGYDLKIDIKEEAYIESTKQEFFKAKDSMKNDIINRAKEAGLSNSEQQGVARKMEQRNNPIELKRK